MGSLIGKSLGRYEILEEIGAGGMAVVYRANDSRLDRDVAIKVIRKGAFPADHMDRILKRFEREAKALARLSHPNIMKVHDYGEHEGSPYLVMEYLPSGTLKKKMGKPMQWEQAIRLILPIAEALDYAHSQNMIHRDVKPSNILLTGRGQPMLTDFGIAKILEVEEGQTLTGTGMGIGTPEYMSPEQWKGGASPRSDIYSLGVVLYELLAGRKPYIADTPADLLLKQATEPLPRLSMFAKGLPANVEKVLFKAMERKPEDRFTSMSEFASSLETLLKGSPASVSKRQMEDSQATFDQFATEEPKKQNRTQTLTDPGAKQGRKMQTPVLLGLGAAGILFVGIMLGMRSGGFSDLFITTSTPTDAPTRTPKPSPSPTLTNTSEPLEYIPVVDEYGVLEYGPTDGSLSNDVADKQDQYIVKGRYKNFILEVKIHNPYATSVGRWSYGISFRDINGYGVYTLTLGENRSWFLDHSEIPGFIQSEGHVIYSLNLDDNDSNIITLLCRDNIGLFYINGTFISQLDLSYADTYGYISIKFPGWSDQQVPGYSLHFEDLTVWSFPE